MVAPRHFVIKWIKWCGTLLMRHPPYVSANQQMARVFPIIDRGEHR